jgi:molybdopterin biosynthesis enzyme MoaB
MSDELKKDFEWYLANQDAMVQQYDGKVIVIKNGTVLGAYDTVTDAVLETQKHHAPGTFIVQRVSEGEEAYTRTFHSRVAFP